MGKTQVTNITIKESNDHAVLQFANSYQRDRDFCNAERLRTTQYASEPLRNYDNKVIEIYFELKLDEADRLADESTIRYSNDEVFGGIREVLHGSKAIQA